MQKALKSVARYMILITVHMVITAIYCTLTERIQESTLTSSIEILYSIVIVIEILIVLMITHR